MRHGRALLHGLVLSALVLAAVCADVASPALLPYTQARIKWGVTAPAPGPLSRAKVAGSLVLTENPLGTDFFSLSDGRNPAWYGNAGGNNTAVPVKDTQVEFGYEDALVVLNTDLTTQGVLTVSVFYKQSNGYLTDLPLTVTLKSAAFAKFKLLEDVNSNFDAQTNATFGKAANTVTIKLARQRGFPGQMFQTIYRLSQCEHGACCNEETGLFKPAGAVCRPKKSSCDATERCTGESRECPEDKDAQDGAKCLWFSDYGKAGAMADRSTLKMSVLSAPTVSKVRTASTTTGAADELLGEDEVCMGHCQHGVCYMAKKEAACCTPASGGGDDGPDGPDDNGNDGPDGPDDNGGNGDDGPDGPDGPDDNGVDNGPDGPDDNGGARRRRRSQRSGRASIAAAATPTYYCWG